MRKARKGRPIGPPLRFWIWPALLLALGPVCPAATPASRVLVVINDSSPASRQIGAYYVAKRHVAATHVCHLRCPEAEETDEAGFSRDILAPVATALSRPDVTRSVDFLVLTKGIPLRLRSNTLSPDPRMTANGDSVDGRLMCQDVAGLPSPSRNPFFNAHKRFSHAQTHLYLATRLDGYSVQDAKALVNRALQAKPATGRFVLDGCPGRAGGGDPPLAMFRQPSLNGALDVAARSLTARGYRVLLDQSETFVGRISGLMGYWS